MILFPTHKISYLPPSNFVEKDSDLFHPANFKNSIDEVELIVVGCHGAGLTNVLFIQSI